MQHIMPLIVSPQCNVAACQSARVRHASHRSMRCSVCDVRPMCRVRHTATITLWIITTFTRTFHKCHQVVVNSDTISNIQKAAGGAMGAFKEDPVPIAMHATASQHMPYCVWYTMRTACGTPQHATCG